MSRPADPNTKVELLRAAEATFVEHGLDRAKVDDITARAGCSHGAFYLHFESKEDAFRQIVETFLARLAGSIDRSGLYLDEKLHHPEAVGDFFERWIETDVEIFEFLWQNRGLVRLMLDGGKSASFSYLIDQFAERNRGKTEQLLRWGVREKLYRADLDVALAGEMICGAYDRVARQLVRGEHKPDFSSLFGEMLRLILTGIGSRGSAEMIDSRVKNRARRAHRGHR
jgi:AcrR family transcriptional regulator